MLFEEFADIDGVEEVHVVGSWAAAWYGEPREVGDIDALVVAEHADRAALYDAADRTERRLGRPVDVIVRSPAKWHAEPAGDPWIAEVRQRPIVTVIRAATQADGGRGPGEEDVAVALGDPAAMGEAARQLVASGQLAPWRS